MVLRNNKRKALNRRRWKRAQISKRTGKPKRQVHLFKRSYYAADIKTSITSLGVAQPASVASVFAFNLIPNVAEFTALYDQYKITGAKVVLTPALSEGINSPLFGSTSTLGFSPVNSVIDYDDSTAPTSEAELLEYGSHKQTAPFKKHVRYLKPKVLQQIYQSSLSTAYRPISNQWLSTSSSSSVPHYGIKYWISAPNTPSGTAGSMTYKMYVTLYFACKNVK